MCNEVYGRASRQLNAKHVDHQKQDGATEVDKALQHLLEIISPGGCLYEQVTINKLTYSAYFHLGYFTSLTLNPTHPEALSS